jgi:hypothetical protein
MALISLTRLRLRSWRFYPGFVVWVMASLFQSLRSHDLLGLVLLRDRAHTFWTLTLWSDREAMQDFRNHGSYSKAMRQLSQWCDESAAAHWLVPDDPCQLSHLDWTDLHTRLMRDGHFAPLPQASANQLSKSIPNPVRNRWRVIRIR